MKQDIVVNCGLYGVFIKYCVFSKDFRIFRTLVFLCFPLVPVCVQHQTVRTPALQQNGVQKNIFLNPDLWYRVFIKFCVYSLKFCDFSELCQFCCSVGVLSAWCVYTHWHQGKTEKDQSPEHSKI